MYVQYFNDTDTLYIQFNNSDVIDTFDISIDMIVDVDMDSEIVAITVEQFKQNLLE